MLTAASEIGFHVHETTWNRWLTNEMLVAWKAEPAFLLFGSGK
jgi:hypothetical protein